MQRSSVLIIDPRGNISLGGKDVINRHLDYAKVLFSKSNESKLVICTTSYQDTKIFPSKFMDLDISLFDQEYPPMEIAFNIALVI